MRPGDLQALQAVFAALAVLGVVVAALWLPLKRLAPRIRLCVTLAELGVSWAFQTSTALVYTRNGYCETQPLWPPFTGQPFHAPQSMMLGISLVAIASIPLVIMSAVGLRRVNWR